MQWASACPSHLLPQLQQQEEKSKVWQLGPCRQVLQTTMQPSLLPFRR